MSHLGDLISALVDGELSGAELDRANTHLAACSQCQAEAMRMRELKRELRDFGEVGCPDELAGRLLAMGNPGLAHPVGPRPLPGEQRRRDRRRWRGRARGRRRVASQAPASAVPPTRTRGVRAGRHHRGRYMLWSVLSLVVFGIGATAFGMGGPPGVDGRQVTPQQLEVFDIQHAITAGEVPFADPSQSPSSLQSPPKSPTGATKP